MYVPQGQNFSKNLTAQNQYWTKTCKNRRPYNLYRVGADVKTMLNQSMDSR